MPKQSILVEGPRELPPAGLVSVWFDTGSGPGYSRQVWATDLRPAFQDDGRGESAIYRLNLAECRG
jgi:hypothetical protein